MIHIRNKMNGFTKVKINKFEAWCCNTWDGFGDQGINWCMAFIIFGIFIVPWLIISISLMCLLHWNQDTAFGLSFFLLFSIDLGLGAIGLNAKDKIDYNDQIEIKTQMNLFRDFGIKYKSR